MNIVLLIICLIWLILSNRAKHIYKSRCVPHSNELAFVIGSILGTILDGIAWYWLFKIIELL